MLLIIKNFILFFYIVLLITGCVRRSAYYDSYAYKSSYEYKKLKNQKINNSSAMHRATMRPYVVKGKKILSYKSKNWNYLLWNCFLVWTKFSFTKN